MRHRHGEDHHRVDVALALQHLRQMTAPARSDPAPDRLPRRAVERGVLGPHLGAAEIPVTLQSGKPAAGGREALALDPGRVRRRPPPGRLDRPAPVRRDDQVGADLVEPLPQLPPSRRAAVAVVEVDRGRDNEDFRRLHQRGSLRTGHEVLVSAPAREDGERRLEKDRDVEPDRPVLDVVEVQPHEVVEGEVRAAGDLPEARDPGKHEVALPVP